MGTGQARSRYAPGDCEDQASCRLAPAHPRRRYQETRRLYRESAAGRGSSRSAPPGGRIPSGYHYRAGDPGDPPYHERRGEGSPLEASVAVAPATPVTLNGAGGDSSYGGGGRHSRGRAVGDPGDPKNQSRPGGTGAAKLRRRGAPELGLGALMGVEHGVTVPVPCGAFPAERRERRRLGPDPARVTACAGSRRGPPQAAGGGGGPRHYPPGERPAFVEVSFVGTFQDIFC